MRYFVARARQLALVLLLSLSGAVFASGQANEVDGAIYEGEHAGDARKS